MLRGIHPLFNPIPGVESEDLTFNSYTNIPTKLLVFKPPQVFSRKTMNPRATNNVLGQGRDILFNCVVLLRNLHLPSPKLVPSAIHIHPYLCWIHPLPGSHCLVLLPCKLQVKNSLDQGVGPEELKNVPFEIKLGRIIGVS